MLLIPLFNPTARCWIPWKKKASYIFLHARGAFLSRHQLYSQSYCQSCKRVVVVGTVDGGMHCFRSEPSFDITAIQELTVLHISRNGIRKKPLVVTNRVFYTITIIFPAQWGVSCLITITHKCTGFCVSHWADTPLKLNNQVTCLCTAAAFRTLNNSVSSEKWKLEVFLSWLQMSLIWYSLDGTQGFFLSFFLPFFLMQSS